MTAERDRLARWWREFAEQQCRGYSPLYERIGNAVAENVDVLDLVLQAPLPGRQPNVLYAAVHDLILRGVEHPLADVYSGHSRADAGPLFCEFALDHSADVATLLSTRRTNTNECGRSAIIIPALRWAVRRIGEPVAILDAGASAGINLNFDRYFIDYGEAGTTGPQDSPVRITCEITGDAPIEPLAPTIAARIGLDREPVDLGDDDEARWQLACVWPDTGRMERTRAAIEVTRASPPEIVTGDLVDDIGETVRRVPAHLPLCVLTTWAVAYLRREDRSRFEAQLAAISAERPVAWISAEGPGVVDGLPPAAPSSRAGIEPSVLACVIFEHGVPDAQVLGTCHPHGTWLDWTWPG